MKKSIRRHEKLIIIWTWLRPKINFFPAVVLRARFVSGEGKIMKNYFLLAHLFAVGHVNCEIFCGVRWWLWVTFRRGEGVLAAAISMAIYLGQTSYRIIYEFVKKMSKHNHAKKTSEFRFACRLLSGSFPGYHPQLPGESWKAFPVPCLQRPLTISVIIIIEKFDRVAFYYFPSVRLFFITHHRLIPRYQNRIISDSIMLLAASPNRTKKKNVRRDFTATTKQNRFETLKIMKSDGEFMECPGLFYSVASHRPIFLAIIIMRYGNFTHRNIERSHLSLWGEKRKESHLIGFLPLVLIKTSIKQPKIAGEVEIDWIEIRLNKFSFTPRGGERKLFRWVSSFRCSISQRRSNFTDVTIHLQFQISFGRILCRGEGMSLICDLNSEAALRIETENKLFFPSFECQHRAFDPNQ